MWPASERYLAVLRPARPGQHEAVHVKSSRAQAVVLPTLPCTAISLFCSWYLLSHLPAPAIAILRGLSGRGASLSLAERIAASRKGADVSKAGFG